MPVKVDLILAYTQFLTFQMIWQMSRLLIDRFLLFLMPSSNNVALAVRIFLLHSGEKAWAKITEISADPYE